MQVEAYLWGKMTRLIASIGLLVTWNLSLAQNLVITNARIIDGAGQTFESGSLVVRDGQIVSLTEGSSTSEGDRIDAQGMTVMPGLIDTHRHLPRNQAMELASVFRGLLENGLTTIMIPGAPVPDILDLRRRLTQGEVSGPRLVTTGPGFTAPNDWPVRLCGGDAECRRKGVVEVTDPVIAQARVVELANDGVDAIKIFYDSTIVPEVRLDDTVLGAIAEEARRQGLDTYVHAESVEELLTAVSLGADRLVHTPYPELFSESPGAARMLREAGVVVATTVSYESPSLNEARGRVRTPRQDEEFSRKLENVRYLWDEGVVVAFGTDSPPALGPTEFIVEALELRAVLTPSEIVASITRNAAEYLNLGDQIGTLEPGKIADIVIIDGDPLTDISELDNVKLVVQRGRIVVDNR